MLAATMSFEHGIGFAFENKPFGAHNLCLRFERFGDHSFRRSKRNIGTQSVSGLVRSGLMGVEGRKDASLSKAVSKSYVVVTHFHVDGGPQELVRYIESLDDCASLTVVSHPLYPHREAVHTCHRIQMRNRSTAENSIRTAICMRLGVLEYIWTTLLSLWWLSGNHINYAIGANCLNMIPLIILKKLGKIDLIVYYCIDYVPIRFKSNIINYIYHYIEKISVRYADVVWNLSSAMIDARESRGYSIKLRDKQITVPIGLYYNPHEISGAHDVANRLFVYVGMLARKQGVFEIVEGFARVIKYFPDCRLRLIGDGVDRQSLELLVEQLELADRIEFMGLVTDRRRVVKLLREGCVGLAPYRSDRLNFSHYADPTKFKDYLMAGLPVIFTQVSRFSEELIKTRSGILVLDNSMSISNGMILCLCFPKYRQCLAENGAILAARYEWSKIFDEAFKYLFSRTNL